MIQTEYREMPGLRLTKLQALDALESGKFLRRTTKQAYVRVTP